MVNLFVELIIRPTEKYLDPGTGSIIIQLITAALGGGLFFLIKSQWHKWFGRKKSTGEIPDHHAKTDVKGSEQKRLTPKKCPNCKTKIDILTVKRVNPETVKCSKCGELIEVQ